MNKIYKRIVTMGIISTSLLAISNVNALEYNNINLPKKVNLEDIKIEDKDRDSVGNKLLTNKNLDTTIRTDKQVIDNDVLVVLETIEYKPKTKERAISVGTKFGSYGTAKFYNMRYRHYMGTVNVDAQGQKISSTRAKINYIKTTKSGFNSISQGIKRKWGVGASGNPAKGGVEVEFTYYAPDEYGSYKTEGRYINIEAYPTGNLKIKCPRM